MRGKAHSSELKAAVVADFKGGMKAKDVAAKHGVNIGNVYSFAQQLVGSKKKKKKAGTAVVPVRGANGAGAVVRIGKADVSLDSLESRLRNTWAALGRGERKIIGALRRGEIQTIRGPNLELLNALAELTEPED